MVPGATLSLSGEDNVGHPLVVGGATRAHSGELCWGLGVSQINGVRVWPAYISSAPGFLLTVSNRRLFKAGGWEACGRPLCPVQGLRKLVEDDGPNSDPPSAAQAKQK